MGLSLSSLKLGLRGALFTLGALRDDGLEIRFLGTGLLDGTLVEFGLELLHEKIVSGCAVVVTVVFDKIQRLVKIKSILNQLLKHYWICLNWV